MKYLVFDAGGTFIKYAIMDETAEIIEKFKVPTPVGKNYVLADYIRTLEDIYMKYRGQVDGIAISAPGVMDSETGYCYSGGSLTYVCGQNPVALLGERCQLPVTMENDGKCAALAEAWKGSLKNVKNGAVIVLGTGVGGGLILNGELYKGSRFAAGEFSYILTEASRHDQADSYWGMVSSSRVLAECVAEENGSVPGRLDGIRIFEMAEQGDVLTLKGIDRFAKKLATQIYNLQTLLDLELISIGGGISQQSLLIEILQKNIDLLCTENPLRKLSSFIPTPKITACTFYNDSNLIGALYHHLIKQGEINNEQISR
ncbi:MAG: ROK family protein [Lachnospiraceae bacterium]